MSTVAKIKPILGWILITKEEISGGKTSGWYICWEETFRTKKLALAFAGLNDWRHPYRAVRGRISAERQRP